MTRKSKPLRLYGIVGLVSKAAICILKTSKFLIFASLSHQLTTRYLIELFARAKMLDI